MTKRKPSVSKNRRSSSESARVEADAKKADASWSSPAAIRETVESVIIAFVLAFLFRTFEAEAFVIPTGSMAPTLMGKHKDLECPMCGYCYQVSASDRQSRNNAEAEVPTQVWQSTCPMCRFTADLRSNNPQGEKYPSYDGDRILVAKFPYEFADPKPWDIIVFKYPGDATMNYIKRLVGLPGETISIRDGDLWIHQPGQPEGLFEIARKPPDKILAMLQPVYDNDLAPTITGKLHWPARWTAEPDNTWTNPKFPDSTDEDLGAFKIEDSVKGPAWIRYRHRVPPSDQWDEIAATVGKQSVALTRDGWEKAVGPKLLPQDSVKPQLISDFTAYNTSFGDQSDRNVRGLIERGYGQHWVGDLAVQFELQSFSRSGSVVAELIKGGRPFQCRFDLDSGTADLSIGGGGAEADGYHRTAKTAVAGVGSHKIIFANVDDELTLWVDGKVVAFRNPDKPDAAPAAAVAAGARSEPHPNQYDSALLDDHIPTSADLSPVGIAAEAASVKVSHIKVQRDIYYISVFSEGVSQSPSPLCDFITPPDLSNPRNWKFEFGKENRRPFSLIKLEPDPAHPEKDRFFVLGDNSAQSSDGRLWRGQYWVERELLIGKALFIYWPHGWQIPYVPLPVNVVPNYKRMHLVR